MSQAEPFAGRFWTDALCERLPGSPLAIGVGIPLLSWVGAALVERGLDRVIG